MRMSIGFVRTTWSETESEIKTDGPPTPRSLNRCEHFGGQPNTLFTIKPSGVAERINYPRLVLKKMRLRRDLLSAW